MKSMVYDANVDAEPKNGKPQAAKDPAVQRGQVVAIITGGISLAIAVFYLALVQILDVRGGEMLPPPPEALNIDCIDCSLLLRQ
ncbi:hypothetical protein ACKKBG_A39425 [Auxenochlorella protothecoides x Auxenochlorella symbiontica]